MGLQCRGLERMDYTTFLFPLYAVGLFIGMILFMEIGRRAGVRRIQEDPESARTGVGTVENASFALLGLLIAFTFFGAATRFYWRVGLIVEEANAIETAYSRLELLPANMQPALRDLFRKYLDSRLLFYAKLPDIDAATKELSVSTKLQSQIWTQAVAATSAEGAHPNGRDVVTPRTQSDDRHFDDPDYGSKDAFSVDRLHIVVRAGTGLRIACWLQHGRSQAACLDSRHRICSHYGYYYLCYCGHGVPASGFDSYTLVRPGAD